MRYEFWGILPVAPWGLRGDWDWVSFIGVYAVVMHLFQSQQQSHTSSIRSTHNSFCVLNTKFDDSRMDISRTAKTEE